MIYDWNKKALSIVLSYNFKKVEDFSIQEIKECLNISSDYLTEDSKKDFTKFMKAQEILIKLAKFYEKEIKEFFSGKKNSLNMNFDIDGIHFKIYDYSLNNNQLSYSANPKKQEITIYTDLPKLLSSDSLSACIHEIIHCLDYNDLKNKDILNSIGSKTGINYLTNPLEYNAITNELFLKAVKTVNNFALLSGIDSKNVVKNKKLLAELLSKMLTDLCEKDNTYHKFLVCQPENKLRRIFNRLYGFVEQALKENCTEFLNELNDLDLQLLFESILNKDK